MMPTHIFFTLIINTSVPCKLEQLFHSTSQRSIRKYGSKQTDRCFRDICSCRMKNSEKTKTHLDIKQMANYMSWQISNKFEICQLCFSQELIMNYCITWKESIYAHVYIFCCAEHSPLTVWWIMHVTHIADDMTIFNNFLCKTCRLADACHLLPGITKTEKVIPPPLPPPPLLLRLDFPLRTLGAMVLVRFLHYIYDHLTLGNGSGGWCYGNNAGERGP